MWLEFICLLPSPAPCQEGRGVMLWILAVWLSQPPPTHPIPAFSALPAAACPAQCPDLGRRTPPTLVGGLWEPCRAREESRLPSQQAGGLLPWTRGPRVTAALEGGALLGLERPLMLLGLVASPSVGIAPGSLGSALS